MKATLEFNLPEDQEMFDHVNKVMTYYVCLFDMDNEIRNYLKHKEDKTDIEDFLQSLRQQISAALDL